MPDNKQELLLRIIQNEISSMGPGYQPHISANPSYREAREDRFPGDDPLPTGLSVPSGSSRPPVTPDRVDAWTQDMAGLLGDNRSLTGPRPAGAPAAPPRRLPQDTPPMPPDIGTQYLHPFADAVNRSNADPRYQSSAAQGSNPDILRRIGDTVGPAVDRIRFPEGPDSEYMQELQRTDPDRAAQMMEQMNRRTRPTPPDMTDSGIPMPPPEEPGAPEVDIPPQAGLDFAGVPPADVPAPRADIALSETGFQQPTPAAAAQAGLQAVGAGQPAPMNAMAPEVFDPETGTRPEEARKLGLLERMFGEKGSDEYRNAGKALMMAGAAIMSTSGSLGEAVANGIQAGLMTYDDAMKALSDEEKEARQMGMTEEAHELNMELKRLQLSRAKQGPVKVQPGLTPVQQAAITADQLISQFKVDPDLAMLAAATKAYGLSPTLMRPGTPDILSTLGD